MKVGQKVQAKIKNRWRDVTIKRVNKTTFRVDTGTEQLTVNPDEIRTKPRKKATPKQTTKKTTTRKSTANTKSVKTKENDTETTKSIPKPGTKKNPWINLYDLRSQSAIADMDYETKVKFDMIIKNLIDVYGYKGE